MAPLFVFLLPCLGSFIFSYYERVSGPMQGSGERAWGVASRRILVGVTRACGGGFRLGVDG